jgi:hypothetical protein
MPADDDENWVEELVVEAEEGEDIQIFDEDGLEAEFVLPEACKRSSPGYHGSEDPSTKVADRRDAYRKDSMEKYIYETGERQNVDEFCSLIRLIC